MTRISKKLPAKIATGNIEIQGNEDSVSSLLKNNRLNYKQDTKAEYKSYLDKLNLADLQRHAVEQGIIPNAVSRNVLTDRLLTKFVKLNLAVCSD